MEGKILIKLQTVTALNSYSIMLRWHVINQIQIEQVCQQLIYSTYPCWYLCIPGGFYEYTSCWKSDDLLDIFRTYTW